MKNIEDFTNLLDLLTTYDTEEKCSAYISLKRWAGKPVCPHCSNNEKIYRFTDGIYFKCGACRKKFTVRVGTIFGDSKIPLTKWFAAVYLFACRSKGVSSVQLARDLKITQKSAWFMLHRLRHGMAHPDYKKPLGNTTEVDESFLGGNEKNRHMSKRNPDGLGANRSDKSTVFGMVERNGEVRAVHVPNTKRETLQPIIISNVKAFSRVVSDEWYGYTGLDKEGFLHSTIKHALKQYVVGDVHTNTIENFWSVLKRNIYGIYHFTSKKHLQRYLEEVAYRFNHRKENEVYRFDLLLQQSNIGELQYKTLIGKA